jgi:hypothetical protein
MEIVVLLLVVLGVLILLGALTFMQMQARQVDQKKAEVDALTPDAKVEVAERPASLIAEQIEEMVKKKLESYPDLADTVFDFGTDAKGEIDIWVNKKRYDQVEDIADERIREAIKAAVATFNA